MTATLFTTINLFEKLMEISPCGGMAVSRARKDTWSYPYIPDEYILPVWILQKVRNSVVHKRCVDETDHVDQFYLKIAPSVVHAANKRNVEGILNARREIFSLSTVTKEVRQTRSVGWHNCSAAKQSIFTRMFFDIAMETVYMSRKDISPLGTREDKFLPREFGR